MSTHLNPYLNFRGQAREAMTLYQSVLGGELALYTFADYGGMGVPEEEQGQVMHSQLSGPGGVLLMGADTPSSMEHTPAAGFAISLSGDDEATLRGWWAGLFEGATVRHPLEAAPWGDVYGLLTDRFGIDWMFNIAGVGQDAGSTDEAPSD